MQKLTVVKIGGNIIDNETALKQFVADFSSIQGHKILVHGGGKLATELSAKLGIDTQMVDGRRITDTETVKVVTMVYAGLINKRIVAMLNAQGSTAIGLSGADAKLLPAIKRPVVDIDYGWVGDVLKQEVNIPFINTLLQANNTIVVAPITADTNGNLLNINADTVATTIAEAMSGICETTLVYCFEKKGVLLKVEDDASVITKISEAGAENLKQEGVINKGMLPKISNAIAASKNGVAKVLIGHAADIKALALNKEGYGTLIAQ
jgi:acetylglutamate kinase